jgi:hypothetical protein
LKIDRSDLRNLDRFISSSSSPLLTLLWCFSVFSYTLTAVATFLACSCLSLSPYHPKEVPQPLDANLDQRLIHVGLLGLMLGCQHNSMWRDMAQQKVLW